MTLLFALAFPVPELWVQTVILYAILSTENRGPNSRPADLGPNVLTNRGFQTCSGGWTCTLYSSPIQRMVWGPGGGCSGVPWSTDFNIDPQISNPRADQTQPAIPHAGPWCRQASVGPPHTGLACSVVVQAFLTAHLWHSEASIGDMHWPKCTLGLHLKSDRFIMQIHFHASGCQPLKQISVTLLCIETSTFPSCNGDIKVLLLTISKVFQPHSNNILQSSTSASSPFFLCPVRHNWRASF